MTTRKEYDANVGQGIERKICFNCGNQRFGSLVPNPTSDDKQQLIWCCTECYKDWYIK